MIPRMVIPRITGNTAINPFAPGLSVVVFDAVVATIRYNAPNTKTHTKK